MTGLRRVRSLVLVILSLGLTLSAVAPIAADPKAPAYRPGPIAAPSSATTIDWPRRAREAVVLGGVAAILVGFRASGLARSGRRRPAPERRRLSPARATHRPD